MDSDQRHFALEDATYAGMLATKLMDANPGEWRMNDGAHAAVALAREFGVDEAVFELSAGGRAIMDAGLAEDLAFCAQVDTLDILPVLHERNITLSAAAVGPSS